MLPQSGHLVMKKISFFGNSQKRKLVENLHLLKNNSNPKWVYYISYSKKEILLPTCPINPYINYPKKEILSPMLHQSLHKLSQKGNFTPQYPINHYISYPKKEILLSIHPINPYISYPKKEILFPNAPSILT